MVFGSCTRRLTCAAYGTGLEEAISAFEQDGSVSRGVSNGVTQDLRLVEDSRPR